MSKQQWFLSSEAEQEALREERRSDAPIFGAWYSWCSSFVITAGGIAHVGMRMKGAPQQATRESR